MKRVFDLVFATIIALLLTIPFIALSIMVKLTSKGSILYWSDRIGINNQLFKMPKLRSMKEDTPIVATHLLENPSSTLTPIGGWLRKSSLDEIPQLWCILKGEMSVVGPRPALYNQTDLIDLRTNHGVEKLLPGLTGWAQINGRDELLIPKKVALDLVYLRHQNICLDVYIILLTFVKVFYSEGVNH